MSSQHERLERARRGLRGLLVVNLVVLFVNLGLFLTPSTPAVPDPEAVTAGAVPPSAPVLAPPPPEPVPPAPPAAEPPSVPGVPDAAPDDPLRAFVDATVAPLRRAASEHEADLDRVLPTDAELAALAEAGSLDSSAGQVVLAKLEEGYRAYNMPFPSLPEAPKRPVAPPTAPSAGEPGLPPPPDLGEARSGADDILGAYFTVQTQRIEREARAQGKDPSALLPSAEACAAAAATARLDSAESEAVLAELRRAYAVLGLPFVEPAALPGAP